MYKEQKVLCIYNNLNDGDMYEQHLTIGKIYEIKSLSEKFPNLITLKDDNLTCSLSASFLYFSTNDLNYLREKKLKRILDYKRLKN